jgi:hypothetical protein
MQELTLQLSTLRIDCYQPLTWIVNPIGLNCYPASTANSKNTFAVANNTLGLRKGMRVDTIHKCFKFGTILSLEHRKMWMREVVNNERSLEHMYWLWKHAQSIRY